MARKKIIRDGFCLKYIPTGRLTELEAIANEFPFIQDKTIALYKYVELFSGTVERCWNTESDYVPISQRVQKGIMKMDNVHIKKILDDLIAHNFLKKDKSTFELGKTSYSYKPVYETLQRFIIYRSFLSKKADERFNGTFSSELDSDCKIYQPVVAKIQFDQSIFNVINANYNYDVYDKDNEILNDINNPNLNMLLCTCSVPCQISGGNLGQIAADVCTCSVPYKHQPVVAAPTVSSLVPYKILVETMPTELISVNKILSTGVKVSPRKNESGRVYTTLTNLPRIYRPLLKLNGKSLVGFDIANSQPLIATIVFKMYSNKYYGCIKKDVTQYQRACESGIFYEYFMNLNNIDTGCEDVRTKFKAEFFGKVFYTKEIEKENYLKTQFKKKYPTCYEAIFNIKGGFYSKDYKKFPVMMTEIETAIMFQTNIELIKKGYDVVNIFDSLYSDNEEAIAEAKKIVINKFSKFGICPKLKDIDYRNKIVNTIAIHKYPSTIKQSSLKRKRSTKQENNSQVHVSKSAVKRHSAKIIKMEITPIKEKEIDKQGEDINFEKFTDEQLGVKSQQQRWMEEGWFKPQAQMNSEYKSDRYDAIERLKKKRKQAI